MWVCSLSSSAEAYYQRSLLRKQTDKMSPEAKFSWKLGTRHKLYKVDRQSQLFQINFGVGVFSCVLQQELPPWVNKVSIGHCFHLFQNSYINCVGNPVICFISVLWTSLFSSVRVGFRNSVKICSYDKEYFTSVWPSLSKTAAEYLPVARTKVWLQPRSFANASLRLF